MPDQTTVAQPGASVRRASGWRLVWLSLAVLAAVGAALTAFIVLRPPWSGSAPSGPILLRTGRTELEGGTVVDVSDRGVAEWSPVDQRHPRLTLSRGSMALAVNQRPAGSFLEVATSHYVFRVLSARFWVALNGQATRLEVTEGQVAVMKGTRPLAQVSAGQSWEGASAGRSSE
jgi:ferric-dicitrate binding protein FerR (iron transport regulator)